MAIPLYESLKSHAQKGRSPFHMPGHKGKLPGWELDQAAFLDVTEIPDTGSLFDDLGPTRAAEELATQYFGTARTLFSAGGSTLCIQAMMRLCAPQGGTVLCSRVMHRSAVNAMALLGIDPVYLYPDNSAGPFFAGRVTPESVAAALREHPDARAVYLTSPDYYGVMSDIRGICAQVDQYHVPVIVDNAHGAHLYPLDPQLHPVVQGAAMSADSAHKTLPVLTGGSFLQIGQAAYVQQAKAAMELFGSTSPSYLILTSLDWCRDWLENGGDERIRTSADRCRTVKSLADGMGFLQPEGPCDPFHIAFSSVNMAEGGVRSGELLREMGVEPEYASADGIILMPSPMNSESDYETLCRALERLPRTGSGWFESGARSLPRPRAVMRLREALLAPAEELPVERCLGRIAAQVKCPCPPAIPVVMPGEELDADCITALKNFGVMNIKVVK